MFESLYRHDGWGIGIVRAAEGALLESLPPVTWLTLGERSAFAADPFLIEEGGSLYCFFESLPYATDRGKICVVEVDVAQGVVSETRTAIEVPYHLSYPFLLRHRGEILCIPEAGESGSVSVFVAHDFPVGWRKKCTLIPDFPGIDPTIIEHEGRWWLFATDAARGWNDALHIWYADDLFGDWRPHRANPVKLGLTGTRPGGRPFRVGSTLYRPAQDCASRYGARLIINHILELTPERFSERAVNVIEPAPRGEYPHGLHTANACNGVIAIDGNRLHFEPRQAGRALMRAVKRRLAAQPREDY